MSTTPNPVLPGPLPAVVDVPTGKMLVKPPKTFICTARKTVEPRSVPGTFLDGHGPVNFLRRTFLIFAPFCDQGLGVQARAYTHWLHTLGFGVCIFACTPSKTSGEQAPIGMQADPKEWTDIPGTLAVLYSTFTRERQSVEPVVTFAKQHGVTDALMLETAHANIYKLARALIDGICCRVWAVPNIEMVRRRELTSGVYEQLFTGVLCHNDYTRDVMRWFRPKLSVKLFPFALPAIDESMGGRSAMFDGYGPIRFLLVGGMNTVSRKQADKVISAFSLCTAAGKAATLTVMTQAKEPTLTSMVKRATNIHLVQEHLSYAHVLRAYAAHHVVLMLGRAEGIGISVHEALRAGCALITMKHTMFTQLVDAQINGWLVACTSEPGKEGARRIGNDDPIVETFTFTIPNLRAVFEHICTHPQEVPVRQSGARRTYETIFAPDRVLPAWTEALHV